MKERPFREELPKASVQVGKPVEITNEEARQLRGLADEMHRRSFHGEKGWFLDYLKAHRAAHEVIRVIFRRSHAN